MNFFSEVISALFTFSVNFRSAARLHLTIDCSSEIAGAIPSSRSSSSEASRLTEILPAKVNKALISYFALLSIQLFSAETAIPIDLIKSILPDNPVVIEAGAQFGEDTDWMGRLWPKGQLYAFEPSPLTYGYLETLAENRPNIFSFQIALSNENGDVPFYLCGGASTLLEPEDDFNRDYFHIKLEDAIMVRTVRLDDWLYEKNISEVDFLWFDMEGNELNALKGSEGHLRGIKLIYTEVNLQRFWKGCVTYMELKNWLESHGFAEIWSEMVPNWQGNALFLNTRI